MLFVTMNIAGLGAFITLVDWRPRHRVSCWALSMAPLTRRIRAQPFEPWLLEATWHTRGFLADFEAMRACFAVSLAYGLFVAAVVRTTLRIVADRVRRCQATLSVRP